MLAGCKAKTIFLKTQKNIEDYGISDVVGLHLVPDCIMRTGYQTPEVINLFSYSTQLSTKFILLINVKMPTAVGILTFISTINTTSERL